MSQVCGNTILLTLVCSISRSLNEHCRFLFLYSFKAMAVIYVSYALKLRRWLRSNLVSVFLLRNEAIINTVWQQ